MSLVCYNEIRHEGLSQFIIHDFASCVPFITITCPGNIPSYIPILYKVKLGYTGIYIFFLFLVQNIDCGYSSEAVLTCTHNP